MEISIFDFSHYKPYLIQMLGGYRRRKGLRLAVSKELQCQPTFVSQVLNGSAHFSLEQAEKASRFLGHSEDEQEYFFLLIQKERSGSLGLRNYHEAKIKQLLARRQVLTHRLGKDTALSKEEQAVYYSSWHFAAVHIAVTIPGLRTKERLADFFRLPQKKAAEILQHLITMGLVVEKNSGFEVGRSKIRIGNNSHNILRHHTNWRNQAIDSLDRETPEDIHYSGVLSFSSSDKLKLKDMILESLKKQLEISDASKEEELFCYNIDFFSLQK